MDKELFSKFIKTKLFKGILLIAAIYLTILIIFILAIEPDPTKVPGGIVNLPRDIIWIIGWRYYLDLPMIMGYAGSNLLLCVIIRKFSKKMDKNKIGNVVIPLFILLLNTFYMIAIDIAVTYFADVYIAGNWESQEIIFIGLNAQKIYHGFFFWFGPNIIVLSLVGNSYLRTLKYRDALKTLFLSLSVMAFTLGSLDPIVCHYLWGNWQIFGDWAMVGFNPMWAYGWVTHYVILGIFWLFTIKLVNIGVVVLEKN